jgi:hypothetical protein
VQTIPGLSVAQRQKPRPWEEKAVARRSPAVSTWLLGTFVKVLDELMNQKMVNHCEALSQLATALDECFLGG